MRKTVRIKAYYPNFFGDDLIAYVSLRIVKYFNDKAVKADVMGISSDASVKEYKRIKPIDSINKDEKKVRRRIYRDAIPSGFIWSVARRIFKNYQINAISEHIFYKTLRKGDIVYLWPGSSLNLYQKVHDSGFTIVSERINTLLSTSKRILDEEYCKLGIHPTHGLTIHALYEELSCMNVADYIFSPSPSVTRSILEAGIPENKILSSSYGLEETEIFTSSKYFKPENTVTAIFVGTICVRKGIHLLLQAWVKADVVARLLIVGRVSPESESILEAALKARSDIQHLDFTEDLDPIYREADFMILPSLEEGSPLVTYLALGARLPVVVSDMGGGGVVEHMSEGIVVDPHDTDALALAIRTMVNDSQLRLRMSSAAGCRAIQYTWNRVARARRDILLEKLSNRKLNYTDHQSSRSDIVPERMA